MWGSCSTSVVLVKNEAAELNRLKFRVPLFLRVIAAFTPGPSVSVSTRLHMAMWALQRSLDRVGSGDVTGRPAALRAVLQLERGEHATVRVPAVHASVALV